MSQPSDRAQVQDLVLAQTPALIGGNTPDGAELAALIEALLLVAPEPATAAELAKGAGVGVDDVERVLDELTATSERGWVVQRHRGRVQLATAPRFAPQVRRFLGLDREARLSSAALETLAIVAYRQPVTRAEIDAVRGVDSSGVLATLHDRGLVETLGRRPTVGTPFEYGVTPAFLRHFGLRSLDDLPPLGELEGRDARTVLEAAIAAAPDRTDADVTPVQPPDPATDTAPA